MSGKEEEGHQDHRVEVPTSKRQQHNVVNTDAVRDLTIPLLGNRMAVLRIPVSLTRVDHKFLTDYFALMRDALIATPDEASDESAKDDKSSDD